MFFTIDGKHSVYHAQACGPAASGYVVRGCVYNGQPSLRAESSGRSDVPYSRRRIVQAGQWKLFARRGQATPCTNCPAIDTSMISLSLRTALKDDSYGSIGNIGKNKSRPALVGALGEATYEVTFDDFKSLPTTTDPTPHGLGPVQTKSFTADPIYYPQGKVTFAPRVMPVHVRIAGCPDAELRHVEDSASDMQVEYMGLFYKNTFVDQFGVVRPWWWPSPDKLAADPDTMKVPIPGWYELDAYHFADLNPIKIDAPRATGEAKYISSSVGPFYWPLTEYNNGSYDTSGNIQTSTKTYHHLVVHRLKVGGAEIIFNAPEAYSVLYTGGRTTLLPPHMRDFQPGDKVTLSFSGITKDLPFPGAKFRIVTPSGSSSSAANANLFTKEVLDQVQVVPNPYIVRHEGQSSTDNAKLYFTRLPPRATIEIYSLDGTLITTLEHRGYQDSVYTDPNSPTKTTTSYFYDRGPGDRSSVEEWNLLTSGRQRVGSQVLFARVIAKDPLNGDRVVGETTTKFAVVAGISK